MNIIKTLVIILLGTAILSCNNTQKDDGKFVVSGKIKNAADGKIYLEQLYFSQKNPEILDTAEIKSGSFSLNAIAPEQGLYRLRLDAVNAGFIFINDKPNIEFSADMNDVSLNGPKFNSPANMLLKNLIASLNDRKIAIDQLMQKMETYKAAGNDSSMIAEAATLTAKQEEYKNYLIRFIDTSSNPVVTMFALGYTRDIDPALLGKAVSNLPKRFPSHNGIASIVSQYNEMMKQIAAADAKKASIPDVGAMAPEITMNDTEGKSFSLSSLKGKYVLVDFWASWCGPCRGENPNVVEAYNKFKDKNFTVLGVSLDEDKDAWLKAIKDDNLSWKQISDLKGWNNAAVPLYGFDGIPYNVLVDPDGKIIATSLRGSYLQLFLAKILK